VNLEKTLEEAFGRMAISSRLYKHVNNLAILVDGTP
jgi:hypothetical protein